MRLSQWRAASPNREAGGAKVAAVVDPVLVAFGADRDPHCWVAWGDEPAARFAILVPTDPGLIHCFVRVNVPGEGPRATTKLIRWNRVAIGELGLETSGGHRLLSFQIEQQVLRGVDGEADDVAAFALRVIAAIDGRPLPPIEEGPRRAPRSKAAKTSAARGAAAKTSAAKAGASRSAPKPPARTAPTSAAKRTSAR
jgi:hypothetical protein